MELFIIDEGSNFDVQHPIHIHGYSPYIIAMERHATEPEKIFGLGGEGISKRILRRIIK